MIVDFICNNCWIPWEKETVPLKCCPMCDLPLTPKVEDDLEPMILLLDEPEDLN